MAKIVVTGGSGMLGRWVVRHFVEQGYEVLSADNRQPEDPLCPTLIVDLESLDQTYGALAGADAVVHMAAIPRAGMTTPEVTFRNNVMSTYNVWKRRTASVSARRSSPPANRRTAYASLSIRLARNTCRWMKRIRSCRRTATACPR